MTTNIIITARPSIWMPTANSTPPFCNHVSVVHDRRDDRSAVRRPRPRRRRCGPARRAPQPVAVPPVGVVDPVDPLDDARTHDSTNDAPTASDADLGALAREALPEEAGSGRTRPPGSSGTSQAWSSTDAVSPSTGRRRRDRRCAGCGRSAGRSRGRRRPRRPRS